MKKVQIKFDKDFYLSIIIGVIGMLTALGMFALSGYMISKSALGTPLYALMILIVTIKLFGFTRAIARYFERLYSHRSTFTMLRNIRVEIFKSLIPLVPNIFRRYRSSDLLNQVVNHVERLQNTLLRVYYPPIVIILTTIITAFVLVQFNLYASIVILVSMFTSVIIIPFLATKRATYLAKNVQSAEKEYTSQYYDFENGIDELKRFNQLDNFKRNVMEKQNIYEKTKHKEQTFLSTYDFLLNLTAMVSIWCMAILCIWQIQSGSFNPIYFASILMITITLFEQAIPMTNVAYYQADTKNSIQQIEEVINQQIPYKKHYYNKKATILSLQKINFKYEYQERFTLKNINLDIQEGSKVAIIGASGSGKTSLLQIMMGLYNVNEGAVTYKDENIANINFENYVDKFNAMLQHNHFFHGTIKENLFKNNQDEILRNVLDKLNLAHLNLEEVISDNAANLSGGERQRLAIARLMIRDCSLWILDEPTSSLDTENEANIMEYLVNLEDTVIIATHNLTYLNQFDQIIVLDEGEIIEKGNYNELMKKESYLRELVIYNQQIA